MKKYVALVFALIFIVCSASCSSPIVYQGPLSSITHIDYNGSSTSMDITEAAQKEILSVLNSGEWVNDVTNCGHDYAFTTERETIHYHASCGTFIDITNGRSLRLSEAVKHQINDILGAEH